MEMRREHVDDKWTEERKFFEIKLNHDSNLKKKKRDLEDVRFEFKFY